MFKVLVSWSSGKDSAWTLYTLLNQPEVEVVGLLTTLNQTNDRVSIHGTRQSLLEQQATSCGIPVYSSPKEVSLLALITLQFTEDVYINIQPKT